MDVVHRQATAVIPQLTVGPDVRVDAHPLHLQLLVPTADADQAMVEQPAIPMESTVDVVHRQATVVIPQPTVGPDVKVDARLLHLQLLVLTASADQPLMEQLAIPTAHTVDAAHNTATVAAMQPIVGQDVKVVVVQARPVPLLVLMAGAAPVIMVLHATQMAPTVDAVHNTATAVAQPITVGQVVKVDVTQPLPVPQLVLTVDADLNSATHLAVPRVDSGDAVHQRATVVVQRITAGLGVRVDVTLIQRALILLPVQVATTLRLLMTSSSRIVSDAALVLLVPKSMRRMQTTSRHALNIATSLKIVLLSYLRPELRPRERKQIAILIRVSKTMRGVTARRMTIHSALFQSMVPQVARLSIPIYAQARINQPSRITPRSRTK